jgi:hypothetical protein
MINVGAPGEGVGSSLLAVRERAESKSPCTVLQDVELSTTEFHHTMSSTHLDKQRVQLSALSRICYMNRRENIPAMTSAPTWQSC